MSRTQVLIAGAGPTGLVLALWLTRQGVKVRIVDKTEGPGTTSRALAVQGRTLELYRQLGLDKTVVERGHKVPAVNLWARGEKVARVDFENVGEGLTPFPFLQIFPQDEHETLLVETLSAAGVEVERRTELLGFEDRGDGVAARLRGPAGEEAVEADYIAGCDGAHSKVRETIGGAFPGGAYRQLFYVADVEATGASVDGELHIDLDQSDFLGVFPLTAPGHVRLVGTIQDERADHPGALTFEDVSGRAIEHMKLAVKGVNWFSTYHVHHRVTDHFRKGRAFVLGDAAHIHSPAGGQGMNTGIGDAINLAWKLAWVLGGKAPDALLDSFEAERIGFARRLVATTDRAFSLATADGWMADLLRTRVAPVVLGSAMSMEPVREYAFRTVSQITLNYRGSPLSAGKVGEVHGGDRLPWAPADEASPPVAMDWEVRSYGAASEALARWCGENGVGLKQVDFTAEHASAGLRQGACYLLRPDTYIAVADETGDPAALARYAAERSLKFR